MKDWRTASDWAALSKFVGIDKRLLPHNKVTFLAYAEKYAWKSKRREQSGGGLVYHISNFPKVARDAILGHLSLQAVAPLPAPAAPAGASPEPTTPAGVSLPATRSEPAAIVGDTTGLTNAQRATMDARAAILQHIYRLAAAATLKAAIDTVVKQAKAGTLPPQLAAQVPLANARGGRTGSRTLSERTLKRWHGDYKSAEGKAAVLAPKAPSPDMTVPPWAPALMAMRGKPSKRPLSDVVEDLAKPGALPMGITPPSYDQVKRFLAKVSTVDKNRGRMGPRELKSIRPFQRRDVTGLWPLDVVQADGHTVDMEVEHPRHHRAFRPEITTIIDLATRLIVGWSASLAENALGVTDAIIYMATKWGVPAVWYVDNGSGFNNQLMDDAHVGVLARLGMEKMNRAPYNAQAGGYIERVQQTVWVKGAKQSPTYMGADMDREARQKVYKLTRADIAKAGRSRHLMRWDEFLAWAETQVQAYNNRPHSGLPKISDPVTGRRRHTTPMEAWTNALAQGWEPMKISALEAADITRPYEIKRVSRCTVQALSATYWSRDLEPFHGDEVLVGYDVHDASKVYVRDLDGRLITIAGFEPTRAPVPRSLLERGYEKRAKGRERRLMAHLSEVRAELNPGLQIDGAAEPVALIGRVAEIHQGLVIEMGAQPATTAPSVAPIPETAEARYTRWREIDADLGAGNEVAESDRTWHGRYPKSAEWRAQDDMHQSFKEGAGTSTG